MRVLALQLKRIGDLILTTPALRALRANWPEMHLALAVTEGCAPLLELVEGIDSAIVFGRGRGFAPWQQTLTGPWDACLDFTGSDRSALAATLSRARRRTTFLPTRANPLRNLAYNRWVRSPVRDRHTVDHYLSLAEAEAPPPAIQEDPASDAEPRLRLPRAALDRVRAILSDEGVEEYLILHAGAARPEKYWSAERWAAVGKALHAQLGLRIVLTGGNDPAELGHVEEIAARIGAAGLNLSGRMHLAEFAALIAGARVLLSVDTAAVHLGAAFRTPQVALFGPTNPFHWRPRHPGAVILSAAQPERPLSQFQPRMPGAPMDRLSTDAVLRATEGLLAAPVGASR